MKYLSLLIALVLVTACSRPVAEFQVAEKSQRTFVAPATISFENLSEKADSFFWSFGDGHYSTEPAPEHTYYQPGNYQVTLKALKNGRSKSMEERIRIAPPEKCLVLIHTPEGKMVVHLYDKTPEHRDNFLELTRKGFYDSLLFHRVIEGFMIQGGDPDSKGASSGEALGMGGPGYTISAEIDSDFIHKKGALAAARKSDRVNPERASSGSQFYIVDGKPVSDDQLEQISMRNGIDYSPEQEEVYRTRGGTPFLDGQYTVFGEVIEGLSVIDSIASKPTDQRDRPLDDIPMEIEVIR